MDVGFIVKDLFTIGRSVLRGCGIRSEDLAAHGGDIASAAVPFATGGGTAAKASSAPPTEQTTPSTLPAALRLHGDTRWRDLSYS